MHFQMLPSVLKIGTSVGLNLLKMHQFAVVVTNNTDESINWASQDRLEEICKRQLDHVINEQLNNLSLPFSWSLSEPSLFSSAGEYQKLLETCRDAGTVIHALTGKANLLYLYKLLKRFISCYICSGRLLCL
jgi:hypothetical protein